MERLAIDLQRTAQWGSFLLNTGFVATTAAGYFVSPYFYIGTAVLGVPTAINFYFKHVQRKHALLRNFGLLAMARYTLESIGPELRQYFFLSDTEERPFDRMERAEVYRKAKNIDSASAFGSLKEFDHKEIKIRHSFFPVLESDLEPYGLTFGEERELK